MDPPDSPPPARKIRQRTASDDAKKKEREARSIAIEKAYVHDVYEQISGIWQFVKSICIIFPVYFKIYKILKMQEVSLTAGTSLGQG